jgi:DNA-binding transcriptional ArsR family regulator
MQIRRDVFQAIADPTRRGIINLIADKPLNLNTISENFDVSRPAISQHIKVLIECGLIEVKQQGRERFCEMKHEALDEVTDWVEAFRRRWDSRFEALDALLERQLREDKNRHHDND